MNKSVFRFKKSSESPGFQFWKATVVWQRQIKKALEPFGVSHAQFVILALLLWSEETKEPSNQIEIARRSNLDKMTVSKSLGKLVAQGFVLRSEDKRDTRAKAVCLTEKGVLLALRLVPVVERADQEFFGGIPVELKRQWLEILSLLSGSEEFR